MFGENSGATNKDVAQSFRLRRQRSAAVSGKAAQLLHIPPHLLTSHHLTSPHITSLIAAIYTGSNWTSVQSCTVCEVIRRVCVRSNWRRTVE